MEKSSRQLTRRSFLKTTAVAAGAATLATTLGCSPSEEGPGEVPAAEEKTYANWCRGNCGGESRCCLETTVREGKVVKVVQRPLENATFNLQPGCVKASANPQRIYGARRVMYPMLQKGERGSDNWERISWDEAIALIAEKMQAAFDEYGPESVGFMSSYGGNSGYLGATYIGFINMPQARTLAGVGPERFFQKTGATLFSATADIAIMYMEFVQLASPPSSIEGVMEANVIVNWGSNPCDATRTGWSRVLDAKEKGAKVITIDPRYSNSAAHSDQWIPVRPSTDGAMMLAMCNYIIDKDLVNYDYLRNKSVAPLLVKEDGSYLKLSDLGLDPIVLTEGADPVDTPVVYDEAAGAFGSSFQVADPAIAGTYDANGVSVRPLFELVRETIAPFTVEFAAEECGLPAKTIEDFATLYATEGPVYNFLFCGMQHYQNSWRMYLALPLLVSLTGNAGVEGTNYALCSCAAPVFNGPAVDSSAILTVPDAKPNKMASITCVPDIVNTGKLNGEDLNLRMLYIAGCDAIANGIGYTEQIEAWKKIDFVVVADPFMTESARQASLVLPVTTTFEAEELPGHGFLNQKAIDPVGESKSDFEIFVEIAKAMGYDDLYDKDAEGYMRAVLDTEENKAAGLDYDSLREKGVVYHEQIDPVVNVGVEYNATGRTQFYAETLFTNGNADVEVTLLDRLPYYEHAFEAYPTNPLRKKYPLFGVSYHDNYTAHCMHAENPWLNELRGFEGPDGSGEPYTIISEAAAAERGIKTGDKIRVFNDRGSFVTLALVSKGIREDTINIPRAYSGCELEEGHLQSVTSIEARDKITNNDSHNDWLCQVEKI